MRSMLRTGRHLNFNPMVQTDIAQLSAECNTWREALRSYREEFTKDKHKLQQLASKPLSKDQLTDVEHFHNQFHVQLINIHDIKQAIKMHERKVSLEQSPANNHVQEITYNEHEKLYDQYHSLEHTLQDLREEFNDFIKRTQ